MGKSISTGVENPMNRLNGHHHLPAEGAEVWRVGGRRFALLLLLGGLLVVMFSGQERTAVMVTDIEEEDQVKDIEKKRYEISPSDLETLRKRIESARTKLRRLLTDEYGNFTDIFFEDSVLSAYFHGTDESLTALKRRLKIRLLEAQITGSSRFVWVSGGHSAAAGHGNLFNQSYTQSLESAARVGFEAAGIEFIGKNYAMGGYQSGPEVALCAETIYGEHIDALSWDFGMTDGRNFYLYRLWANRAGVHPSRPILFNWGDNDRAKIHKELIGLAALTIDGVDPKLFPDSSLHPNPASLPPGVAFYRCQNEAENKDICKEHKFEILPCTEAKYRTSWHPGWKVHLLKGRLVGAFLVKLLQEIFLELGETAETLTKKHLDILIDEEKEEHARFLESKTPTDWPENPDASLYRAQAFCRTAILPNEARYNGLMSEGKKGTNLGGGLHENFELGSDTKQLPDPDPNNLETPPTLVYSGDRQACKQPLQIDFKDYFLVRKEDGWMSSTYPNDLELKAFGRNNFTREGMVVICTRACDWGKCPDGYVFATGITDGNLTVHVDGKTAKDVYPFGDSFFKRCALIKNVGPGNEKGQYSIRFKVNRPKGKLFLSSVIVF